MAWSLAIQYLGEGRRGELDGPGSGQAIRQLFPSWDPWWWGRVGQFGCSPSFHGVRGLSTLKSPQLDGTYSLPTTRAAQLWVRKAQLLPLHRLCLLMVWEVNVRSSLPVAQWSLREANGPVHLLDQVETASPWLPLLLLGELCHLGGGGHSQGTLKEDLCNNTAHKRCTPSLSLTRWLYHVGMIWCGGGLVTKSCPALCDAADCSLPGSSVHGILQARILEWVAISFSRGSSRPRNRTRVTCIAGGFFADWAMREAHDMSRLTKFLRALRAPEWSSPGALHPLSPKASVSTTSCAMGHLASTRRLLKVNSSDWTQLSWASPGLWSPCQRTMSSG